MSANAPVSAAERSCGHSRHVGTCPPCQRAQLTRWTEQLRAVTPTARNSMYQYETESLSFVVNASSSGHRVAHRR